MGPLPSSANPLLLGKTPLEYDFFPFTHFLSLVTSFLNVLFVALMFQIHCMEY
jgi:hypothetical protein